MLKFILKRMIKDSNNGLESTVFITVDCRSEELELLLTKGGVSESGYDVTDMVGVEIIPPAKTSELAATVRPEAGPANTGSPKLPPFGEVLYMAIKADRGEITFEREADIVRKAYDFIERQLRAGA